MHDSDTPFRSAPRTLRLRVVIGLLIALAMAATLAAEEKPAEGNVIYPRAGTMTSPPAPPAKSDSMQGTLLLLTAAAAGLGGWWLWRQRQTAGGLTAQQRKLSIAESRPLGNRQYLVVADYNGQKFLLGVCPGRIEMLTSLDGRRSEPTEE